MARKYTKKDTQYWQDKEREGKKNKLSKVKDWVVKNPTETALGVVGTAALLRYGGAGIKRGLKTKKLSNVVEGAADVINADKRKFEYVKDRLFRGKGQVAAKKAEDIAEETYNTGVKKTKQTVTRETAKGKSKTVTNTERTPGETKVHIKTESTQPSSTSSTTPASKKVTKAQQKEVYSKKISKRQEQYVKRKKQLEDAYGDVSKGRYASDLNKLDGELKDIDKNLSSINKGKYDNIPNYDTSLNKYASKNKQALQTHKTKLERRKVDLTNKKVDLDQLHKKDTRRKLARLTQVEKYERTTPLVSEKTKIARNKDTDKTIKLGRYQRKELIDSLDKTKKQKLSKLSKSAKKEMRETYKRLGYEGTDYGLLFTDDMVEFARKKGAKDKKKRKKRKGGKKSVSKIDLTKKVEDMSPEEYKRSVTERRLEMKKAENPTKMFREIVSPTASLVRELRGMPRSLLYLKELRGTPTHMSKDKQVTIVKGGGGALKTLKDIKSLLR